MLIDQFAIIRDIVMGKKRLSVPPKTRAALQKEIESRRPFCGNEDVGRLVVITSMVTLIELAGC